MKLKEKRLAAGLSQSQLAYVSGVNIRLIRAYEQGTRLLNKAEALNVYKLAQALGLKVEDLLDIDQD